MQDELLELYYTANMANLACRETEEDRQVAPDRLGTGEHLCVRMYPASGTQTVAKRDDALLTQDEVQKHWQEVLTAIKQ